MTVIDAVRGQCPLCKGERERPLFVVRSEVYNGRLCGEHLHGLVRRAKEEEGRAAPQDGGPHPATR